MSAVPVERIAVLDRERQLAVLDALGLDWADVGDMSIEVSVNDDGVPLSVSWTQVAMRDEIQPVRDLFASWEVTP